MRSKFKIAVITEPTFFEGETDVVNALMEEGLELLHIRKPCATRQEMEEYIAKVGYGFRNMMALHDQYELAEKYSVGGIHLNSRNPEPPKDWNGRVSKSCHSIEEVSESLKTGCDYCFLSPIYDSVSKKGYKSGFKREELLEYKERGLINDRVYALGGVTEENVEDVINVGFGGCAILGDMWRDKENLKKTCEKLVRLIKICTFARG